MFGQPWYRGYPNTHTSYNPYVYSPYQQSSPFGPIPRQNVGIDEARARALAEQRARRAQYLPDEVEDEDDDWEYNQLGPRERAFLEAQRRRAILERRQEEEAQAQAQAQAQARQRELEEREWQEALERRQREDEEARQRLLDERKRQLRLKREEEARLRAAAAEQEKTRKEQARSRRASSQGPDDSTSIPIHVHQDSTSPSSQTQSSPSKPSIPTSDGQPRSSSTSRPPTPKPPTPSKYSVEEQNEAAMRIQNQYRVHLSHRTLEDINKEFETLKKNFVYPRTIDFQKPGGGEGHISVLACRPPSDFDTDEIIEPMDVDGPDGKLDFTSTNFAVNSYSDALDKLLIKLDGVESWGKKAIRDKRRLSVKNIEREASKLDRYCKQAWIDYLARQSS